MSVETLKPNIAETPLTYFSQIRLKHRQTGKFLTSHNAHYSHTGGSADQLIVGTTLNQDDNSLWLVRPMHLGDFIKSPGDPVSNNQTIRLQNIQLGTNLHSHNRPSPITGGSQSEVTTYGSSGLGDENDNWTIQIYGTDKTALTTKSAVTLTHITTGKKLHSHEHPLNLGNEELNEVTTFKDSDENDVWLIDAILPAPENIILHPMFSMASQGINRAFGTVNDLVSWLTEERKITIDLLMPGGNSLHPGATNVKGKYDELIDSLNYVRDNLEKPTAFLSHRHNSYVILDRIMTNREVLITSSPAFQYIKSIATSKPKHAASMYAQFCLLPVQDPRTEMRGAFEALVFDYGLSDVAQSQLAVIDNVRTEWDKLTLSTQTTAQGLLATMSAQFRQSKDTIKANEAAYNDIFIRCKEELSSIKRTYEQEFALKASVHYWSNKAIHHRKMSVWFGGAAVTAGILAICVLGASIFFLLHGTDIASQPAHTQANSPANLFSTQPSEDRPADSANTKASSTKPLQSTPTETTVKGEIEEKNPPWWKLGLLLILATFLIWLVRIIVQLFQSHMHLEGDARERETMLLTYLAMLKENVAPKEDHKLLILQTLFRPASTGIIKDDAAPSTWLEILVSKISGGRS